MTGHMQMSLLISILLMQLIGCRMGDVTTDQPIMSDVQGTTAHYSAGFDSSTQNFTVTSSLVTSNERMSSSVTNKSEARDGFNMEDKDSSPSTSTSKLKTLVEIKSSTPSQTIPIESISSTINENVSTITTIKATTTTITTTTTLKTKTAPKNIKTTSITESQPTVKSEHKRLLPDYNIYNNIAGVYRKLHSLADRYPKFMRITNKGRTKDNNDLKIVTLRDFGKPSNETSAKGHVTVLLTYGAYGNELFPVESMLHFVEKLLVGYDSGDVFSVRVFNLSKVIVVPIWNIDARTAVEKDGLYCSRINNKTEVIDLEKNFDWEFKETRHSGKRAFSVAESIFIKDIIDSENVDAYVTFNSGGKVIYLPFFDRLSMQNGRKPDHIDEMYSCAAKMSSKLNMTEPVSGWAYGQAYNLLSLDQLSGGRSVDYISGEKKVAFTFAVQLYKPKVPSPHCFLNYNPSNQNLQDDLNRIFPVYDILFNSVIEWKAKQKEISWKPFPFEDPILTYGLIAIVSFVLLSICVYYCRSKCKHCRGRHQRNKYYEEKSMNYNLLDASDDDYVTSDEETGM